MANRPTRSRSRSRERPGSTAFRVTTGGGLSPDSNYRGRTFNELRVNRQREHHEHHREHRSDPSRAHASSLRDDRQRRVDEYSDRRPDIRRAGEDAGRREQRHDMSRATSRGRYSDSRADSHRRDNWCTDPRRDQPGRHGVREAPRAALSGARGEIGQGSRPPVTSNHGAGGQPSAVQIQLNKRIVGARNFEDILAIVSEKHGEFNAVNVATACSRLAKAPRGSANRTSIDDRRVQALFRTITRVAPTMESQAVANALWAFATIGWQAGEGAMRCALKGAAVRVAPSMNAQEVANTVWAMATLGWQPNAEMAAAYQQLVVAMVADGGLLQLSAALWSQLLQAHLASQLLGLGLITLPQSMLDVAVKARREDARKVTVSNAQLEVGESLRRLCVSHELEYITADGLFSIDLAVVDRRMAIEFDGPSHFTRNTLEPLGHTRLRDRLLSAMGWHVVSIPFFDWDRLQRPEQMDAYVQQRLSQVLAQPQEM